MYRLFLKKVLLLAALMMASTFAQLVHAANAVDIKHRYALVIGNAKYSVPANVLLNPVNDAALVSDALRKRGFQVTSLINQSRAQMEKAVDDFAGRAEGADLALVYYAGHAVAIDGINYLFGVDLGMPLSGVNISLAQQSALSMKVILMALNRAKIRARLLVLDACRVNLTRGADQAGSLAKVVPAGGELIAFSTQPGATAEDGFTQGGPKNSPYAYYFSSRLQALSPDEPVENFFKQVTGDVQTVTQYRQIPSYSASLVGDVTFVSYRNTTTAAFGSVGVMMEQRRGVDPALSKNMLWMRLDDWAIDIERSARNADALELKSMRARAEMGDVMAITELGMISGLGKIVPKDMVEAKRRFEQAAKMGFPLAKTYLAAMLWLGKNTPAEIARARVEAEPLLREAWDGGSHRAARQLLWVQNLLYKQPNPVDLKRYNDETYEYVRLGGDPLNMKMQKNGICPADMSVRECIIAHPEIPINEI